MISWLRVSLAVWRCVEIEFARERVCFAQKPIAATKKMAM